MKNSAPTTSPALYQPSARIILPTRYSVTSVMTCSTAMMCRSDSPNRMAVERTPILMSSLRSTMAYMVSYTVTHSTLARSSNQATRGTDSICAANAIGIPAPKANPKYICGTDKNLFTNG